MPAQNSGTVDERIVELRINDKKFESGAKKAIGILEKLDESLNSLGKANSSGLDSITSSLDKVTDKFSIMGTIGDQVIRNLTNKAMELVNSLTRVSRELTIEQIGAGWSKYADKTQGVQTIMAATAKDWDDQGAQMEWVNEQLERLNWFTDETSYNFLDMVNNIGKFTSNGVKLESAVTAMQGIATWAAISGANTTEASRAMYNMSQAMGTGKVMAIDWKSIENANMATREFKEVALETAAEYKTLLKLNDNTWRSLQDSGHKNEDFTTNQFRDSLKDAWFTSEVLVSTLQKYGDFANALRDATDASDLTASEFLKAMRLFDAGDEQSMKEFNRLVSKSSLSIAEFIPLVEDLSGAQYDLGRRAFQAAQEAKTFKEAIDATKDAVSTSWMNLFEKMFGNYLEAKVVWTDMAESLYSIFAEPVNKLNAIFEVAFGKEGPALTTGQQLFTEGFNNILRVIVNIAEALGQAFDAVFGTTGERGEQLYYLIERFNRFTKALVQLSTDGITPLVEGELGPLAEKFAIVLSVIKSINSVVKSAFKIVFGVIGQIVSKFFELYQALNANGALSNFAAIFSNIFYGISVIVDHVMSVIPDLLGQIFGFTDKLKGMSIVQIVAEWIGSLSEKILALSAAFVEFISSADGSSLINGIFGSLLTVINAIVSVFSKLIGKISSGFNYLKIAFKAGGIKGIFEGLFTKLTNAFASITASIRDFVKDSPVLKTIFSIFELAFGAIIGLTYGAYTAVSKLFSVIGVGFDKLKSYLPTMESIRAFFSSIGESIGNRFSGIKEFFASFKEISIFGSVSEKITNFFDSAKEFFSNFKIDFSGFTSGFQKVKDFFSFLFEDFLGNAEVVKEKVKAFVSYIWQGFIDGLNSITISDIYKVFKMERMAATIGVLFSITDSIKRIGKEIQGIPESISETISNFGDAIKQVGRSFQANYLLKMAAAVAIVTAALYVLANKIDPNRLTQAAAVLVVVMLVLSRLFKTMQSSKIFNQKVNVQKIQLLNDFTSVLIGLAAVILAVGIAVAKVAKIGDPKLIERSVYAILGLLLGLALIIYGMMTQINKLSTFNDTNAVGKAIMRIGITILVIAVAVRMLVIPVITLATTMKAFGEGGGKLLWSAAGILMVFLGILGVIMLRLVALLGRETMSPARVKAVGNTMLKMAGAIAIVAVAIGLLVIPLIALAAALGLPGVGTTKDKKGKKVAKPGFEKQIIKAAELLSKIAVILVGIFAALILFTKDMSPNAMRQVGNNMLKMAASMFIVALAVSMLVVPLLAIASTVATVGGVAGAVFALLGLVAGLAAIMVIVGNKSNGGKSILYVAAGIALLAIGFGLLLPKIVTFMALLPSLVKRLNAANIGFWKLVGLGVGLILIGAGFTLLGAGATLLGVGILAAGAGVLLFAAGLAVLMKVLEGIGPALKGFFQAITEAGEMLTGKNLINFGKGAIVFGLLAAAVWLLAKAFGALFGGMDIGTKLTNFATTIGKFVGTFTGTLLSTLGTVFSSIGKALASHLPSIQTVIISLITIVGLFVVSSIPSLVNVIGTAIISLLASLYLFVKNNKNVLEYYIFGIVSQAMNIFSDAIAWAIRMILPTFKHLLWDALGLDSWMPALKKILGEDKAKALEAWFTVDEDKLQKSLQNSFSRNEDFWNSVNPFGDVPPAVHQITEEQAASLGIDYKGGLEQAKETIISAGGELKETVATSVGDAFSVNTEPGSPVVDGAKDVANTGTNTLINTVIANIPGIQDSGFNIGAGLATGMNNSENLVSAAAGALGDLVPAEISNHLQIKSPSRVMAKLAAWIPAGLARGIEDNTSVATDSMTILSSAVLAAMQEAMLRVATIADDNFEFNPSIVPVVDLSNVTAAAGSAGSIFGGVSASMKGAVNVVADNAYGTMSALQYNSGNENIVNEIQQLGSRLDLLGDRIAAMSIVLDTGVLVGATSSKMDNALGVNQIRKQRGN